MPEGESKGRIKRMLKKKSEMNGGGGMEMDGSWKS